MAITLSHGGPTTYRSPARSRHVLVGTIEGVACIERDSGGPGWHVAHRTLTDKHIHALLIEPESGTIFAGANHGSIYASTDGGRTWERRDEGLTQHNVYSLECARRARRRAHLRRDGARAPLLQRRSRAPLDRASGPAIGRHVPVGISPPRPTSPTRSTSPFIRTIRHPVHWRRAGRSAEEHRCGTHVPGGPGNGRRCAPHGDQSAEPRPMYITTGIGMYVSGDGGRRGSNGPTDSTRSAAIPISWCSTRDSRSCCSSRRPRKVPAPGVTTTTRARASPGARTAGRPGRSCGAGCPIASGLPSRRCVWRTGGHRSRSSPRRRRVRRGAATTAASSGRKS